MHRELEDRMVAEMLIITLSQKGGFQVTSSFLKDFLFACFLAMTMFNFYQEEKASWGGRNWTNA